VIRNISDIFLHSDLGRRQGLRVQGGSHVPTRRSPWSHQSPSMRGALELNPRNIHTGVPTRYYRGIIQTYLYPSPMTADMTCDRLRYRLHDMPRSLSLAPAAFTILRHPSQAATPCRAVSCPPSLARCHRRWKICNLHDVQSVRVYVFLRLRNASVSDKIDRSDLSLRQDRRSCRLKGII